MNLQAGGEAVAFIYSGPWCSVGTVTQGKHQLVFYLGILERNPHKGTFQRKYLGK